MSQGKALEVVCAIIHLDNRILAARRNALGNLPLHWEFPGGKIEINESAEAALERELWEELRLKVKIIRPIEPVEYSAGTSSIRLIPFLCEPDQEPAPVPVEHSEIRWITAEQSKQLTWAPADIPLVQNLENFLTDDHE